MGFLQVGPLYFPPQPFGAQIIRRGPHGQRFAQDPQSLGDGKWRWWYDQMVDRGALEQWWAPQQVVVGVQGMGDVASEIADRLSAPFTWLAQKTGWIPSETAGDRGRTDVAQTAGTVPQASKVALTEAVKAAVASTSVPASQQAELREQIMRTGRWTDRGPGWLPQPELLDMLNRAQVQRLLEEKKVSPTAANPDGSPAKGSVAKAFQSTFRAEAAQDLRSAGSTAKLAAAFGVPTVLALGAGALAIYGLTSGLGKGLATRKRNPGRRRRRSK